METTCLHDNRKRNRLPGPWDSEPDKTQWTTRAGLPGLIVRNDFGALCGYAAVNPDHPLYGTSYEQAQETIDVHGGVLYARKFQENCSSCHSTDSNKPSDLWWFGFHCSHAGDAIPALEHLLDYIPLKRKYRDITYVTREVEDLATQLTDTTNRTVTKL